MRGLTFSVIVLGVVSFAIPKPAVRAGPVTFGFSGAVTSVSDSPAILQGAVVRGSPFSGSYTFDPLVPDANPRNPGLGEYPNAVLSLGGRVGDLEFNAPAGPSGDILVFNNNLGFPSDRFMIQVFEVVVSGLGFLARLTIGFTDSGGETLSSDALFLEPPDLGLLDGAGFEVQNSTETVRLVGELTAFFVVPDPETSVLVLFGLGLVGCGTRRVPERT